jgi:hypothetical protein
VCSECPHGLAEHVSREAYRRASGQALQHYLTNDKSATSTTTTTAAPSKLDIMHHKHTLTSKKKANFSRIQKKYQNIIKS